MKKLLNSYIADNQNFIAFPYISEYATEYSENKDVINMYAVGKFGALPMLFPDDVTTALYIRSILMLNKYKYDTLYATIHLDYNPIWNVDGEEERVVTSSPKTSTTSPQTTTNVYGDTLKEFEKATHTTNEKFSSYPYDSNVKTAKNETDFTDNGYTDIETETEHTDTTTQGEFTVTESEHTTTDKLKRHGNIGVTSTQHLINEERNVADFRFWEVVLRDVVSEITIPFYESEV